MAHIKHNRVWKKKLSVKNLERAKPGYSEQDGPNKTLTAREEGRADELGEYV